MTPPPFAIRLFDKALHDRGAFSCGFAPIDNFLKSSLSDQIKSGMVAAYMATEEDDPAVLGFYTLGALAVRADLGPKAWSRARVPDVPVIYIRAVAVRADRRGIAWARRCWSMRWRAARVSPTGWALPQSCSTS